MGIIYNLIKKFLKNNSKLLDQEFLNYDKSRILRTNNIQNIPFEKHRTGGKISYGEWAHVIGIFQTLIYQNLNKYSRNKILDVGCGTGLLGMACQNYVEDGFYLGIDVIKENIDFCKSNYSNFNFLKFEHLNVNNALYANYQKNINIKWNVKSDSLDMVTALSVWTHLNENDAIFYFNEIGRVLKKGGKALITMFFLDESYYSSLNDRLSSDGKYHKTNQNGWVFDTPLKGSKYWYYPKYLKTPENAIGITVEGVNEMIKLSGLSLTKCYQGSWKEKPSVYFQDILIFEKKF